MPLAFKDLRHYAKGFASMLRASLFFFTLGILFLVAGIYHFGGVGLETGRTLLFVSLAIAILFFGGTLAIGRKMGPSV